ncbi:hypothetical protein EDD90_2712 [Streptomyces sp. Ag109_O5-1]|uniref:hypothetical protein n=1 Tax=Streptomyces sp. Ag109_O5-1 TaxID=1938851 RepID=UPI000F4EBC93|nr:hypothetical protein [Streptomyces sp. Ag109_O5-1]RPE39695.1 hypothetical protein EDD90_2712 [Streptomyces sp. Ag109_O5-1]
MVKSAHRPPQCDGAAVVLFEAMSGISEAAYGVRWAPGTEYGVWTLLSVPRVRWGRVRADHADVAPALTLIRALVLQAGQWIVWPTGERAPMVMSLNNWRARYASAAPAGRRLA